MPRLASICVIVVDDVALGSDQLPFDYSQDGQCCVPFHSSLNLQSQPNDLFQNRLNAKLCRRSPSLAYDHTSSPQQDVTRHLFQSPSLSRTQLLPAPSSGTPASGLRSAQPKAVSSRSSLATAHHHDLHLFHTSFPCSQHKYLALYKFLALRKSLSVFVHSTSDTLSSVFFKKSAVISLLFHQFFLSRCSPTLSLTLCNTFSSLTRIYLLYSGGSCLENLACASAVVL